MKHRPPGRPLPRVSVAGSLGAKELLKALRADSKSLRGFANDAGVNPGTLSHAIRAKPGALTLRLVGTLCDSAEERLGRSIKLRNWLQDPHADNIGSEGARKAMLHVVAERRSLGEFSDALRCTESALRKALAARPGEAAVGVVQAIRGRSRIEPSDWLKRPTFPAPDARKESPDIFELFRFAEEAQ